MTLSLGCQHTWEVPLAVGVRWRDEGAKDRAWTAPCTPHLHTSPPSMSVIELTFD